MVGELDCKRKLGIISSVTSWVILAEIAWPIEETRFAASWNNASTRQSYFGLLKW